MLRVDRVLYEVCEDGNAEWRSFKGRRWRQQLDGHEGLRNGHDPTRVRCLDERCESHAHGSWNASPDHGIGCGHEGEEYRYAKCKIAVRARS